MNKYEEARNTKTSPKRLARLAKDSEAYVRWGVAQNTSSPSDVLAHLAKDSNAGVRWRVAYNTSSPPNVLAHFVKDSDVDVRYQSIQSIYRHPDIPQEAKDMYYILTGIEKSK